MPQLDATPEERPFDKIKVFTAYTKLTQYGFLLFAIWGGIFLWIRFDTGKWPGQKSLVEYHERAIGAGGAHNAGDTGIPVR